MRSSGLLTTSVSSAPLHSFRRFPVARLIFQGTCVALLARSFFHADRIKTPTLFMGGTRDFNVPVAGAEQMYQALRSLGVETGLIICPDQRHELGPLSYQRDRMERYASWFCRFLKP